MRQKVVIACGLVRDAVDAAVRRAADRPRPDRHSPHARHDHAARARQGAAVLLSSHLLHLVEEVCTRVIIMAKGRKVADGTVKELAARAELATAGSNLEQIFLEITGHGPQFAREEQD